MNLGGGCRLGDVAAFRVVMISLVFSLGGCWLDDNDHVDMGVAVGFLEGCASYWRLGQDQVTYLVNANLSNGKARQVKVPFETSRVLAIPDKGGMISAKISRGEGTKLFFIGVDGREIFSLSSFEEVEGKPALSPDGARVAFHASTKVGGLSIKIADLAGENREDVICPERKCHSPAWSIDGKSLYFLGGDARVYRLSLADENLGVIYEAGKEGKVTGVAEMSAEKVLISEVYGSYQTRNGGALKLVGLAGGEVERVAGGEDEIVALSYAGSDHAALYVKNIGLQSQRLYIYDIATKEEFAISKPGWIVGGVSWNQNCIAGL